MKSNIEKKSWSQLEFKEIILKNKLMFHLFFSNKHKKENLNQTFHQN